MRDQYRTGPVIEIVIGAIRTALAAQEGILSIEDFADARNPKSFPGIAGDRSRAAATLRRAPAEIAMSLRLTVTLEPGETLAAAAGENAKGRTVRQCGPLQTVSLVLPQASGGHSDPRAR